MNKQIELADVPNGENKAIEVRITHCKASRNSYSGANMPAGYYLSVQPVEIDGCCRSFDCFTSKTKLLEEGVRFNAKRMQELGDNIASNPILAELVAQVRAEQAGASPLTIR